MVWWFLAAAAGPQAFADADGLITSWLGGLVLILSLVAFWYHFFNGIRHLAWDAGFGFDLPQTYASGWAVVVATAVGSVLVWAVGLWLL